MNNMHSKKIRIIISVILVVVFIMVCMSCMPISELDPYVFMDISECENIITNKHDNAQITKYESPANDQYLKNLEYAEFWAAEYSCPEFKFELYAYEFVNSDVAKQYFNNITGKKSDDVSFSSSSGMTKTRLAVVDHEKAYILFVHNSDFVEVNEFLGETWGHLLDY